MYNRLQALKQRQKNSCFLWGARQTGKSTLLKDLFPSAPYYDLLLTNEFMRLNNNPSLLREELLVGGTKGPVIIDEVQKIPLLLDEIQWLIVNKGYSFILCGSSARKLKRGSGNLLGGRALKYLLFPLVSHEIPDFDLQRALNHGMIPRHYLAKDPKRLQQAYVGEYLKEEIAAEALTRNIPAFSHFLEAAAFSNGEMVNYQNIATDCGISAPTVKEYFQILEDTLIGYFIPAFRKKAKRRVIGAPKFYFFDLGIVNYLLKRENIAQGSELFGRSFEHLIMQELMAHRHYSGLEYDINYWRTASGFEVDFILDGGSVAIEIKGVPEIKPHHLKGLRAFIEDHHPRKSIVVSLDPKPRLTQDNIQILPYKVFLENLWKGKIMS